MAHSTIPLTQSRYYSPAFNAAVFDGPIRIYFAQHQESLALKVYFRLQQYLKESYSVLRESFKTHGHSVFLMLYPNSESFESAFPVHNNKVVVSAKIGDEHVLGVRGPLEDSEYDRIFEQVKVILENLDLGFDSLLAPELAAP